MTYEKSFYSLLRKDRHDSQRANAFDEAYPLFSEPEKEWCERALTNLMDQGLGAQQAKALVATILLFVSMKVDEQDKWREHGEYLRAEFEWATMGKRAWMEEMV